MADLKDDLPKFEVPWGLFAGVGGLLLICIVGFWFSIGGTLQKVQTAPPEFTAAVREAAQRAKPLPAEVRSPTDLPELRPNSATSAPNSANSVGLQSLQRLYPPVVLVSVLYEAGVPVWRHSDRPYELAECKAEAGRINKQFLEFQLLGVATCITRETMDARAKAEADAAQRPAWIERTTPDR